MYYQALPLAQMTVEDKIRTMEELWDNLCKSPETINSPAWHQEVLSEREESVRVGEAVFEDWGNAKKKIRESLT